MKQIVVVFSLFIVFATLVFFGSMGYVKTSDQQVVSDTTIVEVIKIDSTMIYQRDSLKLVCDSLKTQLFLNKYKVEKVKFYLNICMRDKTQDKFLKGWVRRAIE